MTLQVYMWLNPTQCILNILQSFKLIKECVILFTQAVIPSQVRFFFFLSCMVQQRTDYKHAICQVALTVFVGGPEHFSTDTLGVGYFNKIKDKITFLSFLHYYLIIVILLYVSESSCGPN